MKYLSTFSGIEAASVAWHPLGFEPIGFSEIDPFASAVLAERFPTIKNYGDITKSTAWDIEPGSADIIIGGSPCQSFSIAGNQIGLADPRGNLALTFIQLAARLRARWLVWENVPNALNNNGGEDFAAVIYALSQCGYGICWRVLDAAGFGLPQRRKRLFIVGNLTGWQPAAQVLFEQSKGFALDQDGPGTQPPDSSDDSARASEGGPMITFQPGNLIRQAGARPSFDHITTLKASSGDQCPWIATEDYCRQLTPIDYERCQGFPDDWTAIQYKGKPAPDHLRRRACGNSMAVPVMRFIGERIKAYEQTTAQK